MCRKKTSLSVLESFLMKAGGSIIQLAYAGVSDCYHVVVRLVSVACHTPAVWMR
jgi:hypothetical protein